MRSLSLPLFALILIHSLLLCCVSKVSAVEDDRNKPRSVKDSIEERWAQLEEDVRTSRLGQRVTKLEHGVETKRKRFERRIEADVFKQWQGSQRLLNSARDYVGFVLGGTLTFVGGGMVQTSTQLQAAQLSWGALHKFNVTRGIQDPFFKDIAAAVVAATLLKNTSGTPLQQALHDKVVPLGTIGLFMFRSAGIVMKNLNVDMNSDTKTAVQFTTAGIGTALMSLAPIPLPIVASSVAGATLMYESLIREVVGNWFHLLTRLTPEKRRDLRHKLRHQAYRQLQKKLLFPVHNAYDEIQAAFHNETLADPTLHDRIHMAVRHSMQVKIVWSVAAAGVVFQLALKEPMWNAIGALRVWWVGRTRSSQTSKKGKK